MPAACRSTRHCPTPACSQRKLALVAHDTRQRPGEEDHIQQPAGVVMNSAQSSRAWEPAGNDGAASGADRVQGTLPAHPQRAKLSPLPCMPCCGPPCKPIFPPPLLTA